MYDHKTSSFRLVADAVNKKGPRNSNEGAQDGRVKVASSASHTANQFKYVAKTSSFYPQDDMPDERMIRQLAHSIGDGDTEDISEMQIAEVKTQQDAQRSGSSAFIERADPRKVTHASIETSSVCSLAFLCEQEIEAREKSDAEIERVCVFLVVNASWQ